MNTSRLLPFIIAFILTCIGQANAEITCSYDPSRLLDAKTNMPFSAPLQHGVNLSHWWEDQQDRPISTDDILRIRFFGFDFVRLPLSPTWLEIKDPEEQKKKLARLRCDIVSIVNEGMSVIIDLHAPDDFQVSLAEHPEEVVPHLEKLWTDLQPVIDGLPAWRIYLGLYNEPKIDTVAWWRMQQKLINDLRILFPENTFIASPGPFNGWWQLTERRPYEDKNVIYDFHFYEPMVFTHHGAEWLSSTDPKKPPSAIAYPVVRSENPSEKNPNFDTSDPEVAKYVSQDWNRGAIATIIRGITAWREHYNAQIACFEFGVYRAHVDNQSRYNWLRDVRAELDGANIPWGLWEYRGPFGLIDTKGVFDKGMAEVLAVGQNKLSQ